MKLLRAIANLGYGSRRQVQQRAPVCAPSTRDRRLGLRVRDTGDERRHDDDQQGVHESHETSLSSASQRA